jgi:hypothetical protein
MAGKSEGFSIGEGLGFAFDPRLDRAYAEGREAAAANAASVNPHQINTDEYRAWETGFTYATLGRKFETASDAASTNIYLVKSTGTKVSGVSSSSADPAVRWADSNCYPTVEAAMNASISTGNCIIVNDEAITETGQAIDTGNSANKFVNLRSRSGDPANCSISIDSATASLINYGENNNGIAKTFQGIKFTRSVAQTSTNPMINISGTSTADVNWRNCVFGDYSFNADVSVSNGAVIQTGSNTTQSMFFTDCEFADLSVDQPTNMTWIRLSGQNRTFNLTRVKFRNISNNRDEDSSTGWCFHLENNNTYVFKNCEAIDGTCLVETDGINCRPWAYMGQTTPIVFIQGFVFRNMTIGDVTNTPDANGWGFYISGDHSIDGVRSYDCIHEFGESAFDGGQLYLHAANAVGTVHNIAAYNCKSRSGSTVFSSNGANSVIHNATAVNCESEAGPIYSGGVGDFEVYGADVRGCSITNEGAIFARVNGSTRDKTVVIERAKMSGNTTSGGSTAGIKFESAGTSGNKLTATARKCDVRNSGDTFSYESETGADIDGFTVDCIGSAPTSGTTDTNYEQV